MNVLTKAVIGGRERPAISSHTLAPVYPDRSHAHLLTKMRNALSNMDEAFKADNVKIVYLKGPAKRWSEVQFTEAGAYKFLAEYEDSPYPQLKKFAGDARPVVAAHFTAAGPDRWAAELDALKAKNIALADELAKALAAAGGIAEDRDAYREAADEWKAKYEKALAEKDAVEEFDRQRILNLEAALDAVEENAPDEDEAEEEAPRKRCMDCVDCADCAGCVCSRHDTACGRELAAKASYEDAGADRKTRLMEAVAKHLAAHGVPSPAAAILSAEAIFGLGDGGLVAAIQRLA